MEYASSNSSSTSGNALLSDLRSSPLTLRPEVHVGESRLAPFFFRSSLVGRDLLQSLQLALYNNTFG